MPKQGKGARGGSRGTARGSAKGSNVRSANVKGRQGARKNVDSRQNKRSASGHKPKGGSRGANGRGLSGSGNARAGRNSWQSKRKGSSFGTARGRAQVRSQQRNASGGSGGSGTLGVTGPVVEGRRAVAEALEASLPARRAFIAARSHGQDPTIARLASKLKERGIPIEEVSRSALDALSYRGAHQGIALEVEDYPYADLHEIIEAASEGDALVICLDHVEDEGNLGAIARSAECAGAAGLVIANRRAASVGAGAYKASAGALAHLKVAQVPNIAQAVDELKRAGFWAVCASEHAREVAWEEDLSGRLCLVVGGENKGVSRLVREHCDAACALPQMGAIESLNVAQATTVLAYEWLRQTMTSHKGEEGSAFPGEPAGELQDGSQNKTAGESPGEPQGEFQVDFEAGPPDGFPAEQQTPYKVEASEAQDGSPAESQALSQEGLAAGLQDDPSRLNPTDFDLLFGED